jgi:translation initiation factor IF-2
MTDKKKTLTVSANFKKKPDNFNKDKFSKPTRFKPQEKKNYIPGVNKFARKNIEQESRKKLITKNDNKTRFKSKLKLNTPLSKGRELKLSLNNADDIEEIEIKQRSLASLKRARLKEKKTGDNETEKKEFKKIVRDVKIPERIGRKII